MWYPLARAVLKVLQENKPPAFEQDSSFKAFLTITLKAIDERLPPLIREEIARGHCLLLKEQGHRLIELYLDLLNSTQGSQ